MIPRKIVPGDSFSKQASDYNELVDATEDLRIRQATIEFGNERTDVFEKGNIVSFLNSTGTNLAWYGIVEINEGETAGIPRSYSNAGLDEVGFKERVYVNCIKPTGDKDGVIGICQKPVEDGCVGRECLLVEGITQAIVRTPDGYSLSDNYTFAKPIEDDVTRLELAEGGPIEVIWRESGLGDKWALVWLKRRSIASPLRPFELKDSLSPGGNATAYLLDYNGGYSVTETEFEVYDELGIWRGRKKDEYTSPHDQGSRGYAKWMEESEQWAIVQMQQSAVMIQGSLTADLQSSDSTFTISSAHVIQPIGGIITDQDPAGNITVYNVFSWEGDNGGLCIAVWNEYSDHWEALQVECPS